MATAAPLCEDRGPSRRAHTRKDRRPPAYSNKQLRDRDNIRFTGDLRSPSPPVRPDGFDFVRQNYFGRIGAITFTAYPIKGDANVTQPLTMVERLTVTLSELG